MQTISTISSVTLTSATGILTGSGSTNVSDGDTVTIGSTVYRFKTVMAQINDIQIGGSGNSDTSLNNLIDAINGTGSAGTNWYAGTVANTQVSAGALAAHAFTVTASSPGIYGQNIVTSTTSVVLAWGAAALTGGTGVTIVGIVSQQTFTQPSQIVTIAEYPTNPNWSRGHRMTNGAHICRRNGSNFLAMLINCFGQVAVALEPSLSWAPLITTQPSAKSCIHNSTAAIFTVVAGVTETPLSYQWQYSANGSTGWTNATGTVNGCAYTNGTTASLTCTPTTTGQTGYFHRCIMTNASGNTTTASAVLTIT